MRSEFRLAAVLLLFQLAVLIRFLSVDNEEDNQSLLLAGETIDFSGQYRIVHFYKHLGIPKNYNFYDLSLATQCSVNHLHHLVELAERWKGPISCGVFAPNLDASCADDAIGLLRRCFPYVKKHVTFHLVYPSEHPADLSQVGSWSDVRCDELLGRLEKFGNENYAAEKIPFPHNVLRNAARLGIITEYVLLIDIDTVPNLNLRTDFNSFIEKSSLGSPMFDRTVFVLPAFEIKLGFSVPGDKLELLEGVKNSTVRPFHNETCWWCHRSENFDLWKKIPMHSRLGIAFYADWDKSWEPFYISKRDVPLFDERFRQYGFDRIQQICELHVAGYKFAVLNNAFVVHHGWKYKGKFYASKDADNAQNWILFNYHFKDNLQSKYNTSRTCSPLQIWTPTNKRRGVPNPIAIGNARVISRFKPNVLAQKGEERD